MNKNFTSVIYGAAMLLMIAGMAAGQQPSGTPSEAPRSEAGRSAAIAPTRQLTVPVVTVVHHLAGLPVLRLLRRYSANRTGRVILEDGIAARRAVHTSITAGLPLSDGHTIVTLLPRGEAELQFPSEPGSGSSSRMFAAARSFARPSGPAGTVDPLFGAAYLEVLPTRGPRVGVGYVGLDGATGLSLLKVEGPAFAPSRNVDEDRLSIGQHVRVIAPESVRDDGKSVPGTVRMRLAEVGGKLIKITRMSGKVSDLVMMADKLSPGLVGGVVLNDNGETLGIVDSCDANEAHLLPATTVERAAERVLARRSSVPRPWLGVRGETFAGWPSQRSFPGAAGPPAAADLSRDPRGILLTSVVPGTPAAGADLRPGDIIVRVNNLNVRSAEDLSAMLRDVAAGEAVQFTVLRDAAASLVSRSVPSVQPAPVAPPSSSRTFSITVRLSGLDDTAATMRSEADLAFDPLESRGIETLPLSQKAAAGLGARGGLLVIFVQPGTAGELSGMLPGDVIETIGGKMLPGPLPSGSLAPQRSEELLLGVVRNGKSIDVKLRAAENTRQ